MWSPSLGILPDVGRDHAAIFKPAEPFADSDQTELTSIGVPLTIAQHEGRPFPHFRTSDPNPAVVLPAEIQHLCRSITKRSQKQSDAIAAYYRGIAPSLDPARQQLASVKNHADELLAAVPKCLVTTSGRAHCKGVCIAGIGWMNWDPSNRRGPHFLIGSSNSGSRSTGSI